VSRLRLRLENGLKVFATGRIGVYEPRGTYQLIADHVELAGVGELQRLFEDLKERLRQEGLFQAERKRPLPFLPARIGIITSPGGAALQDVLRVLYRRHPHAAVRLVPVRVQGEGAAAQMTAALDLLQADGGQVDVILLTRGGGSLEDLWAFNDEALGRAIAACSIPVVSAVGHEVDFSISDFVADVRAQTPTKAGEILVPDLGELQERLGSLRRRLSLSLRGALTRREMEVKRLLRSRFFRRPRALVDELLERCDDAERDLKIQLYNLQKRWEDALTSLSGRLEALNPRSVLKRGYSLTMDVEGRVVKDVGDLRLGELVRIELARGRAKARVMEREPPEEPKGGEGPSGGDSARERSKRET
jgi:exodeoxyribonuclease VII large subunit